MGIALCLWAVVVLLPIFLGTPWLLLSVVAAVVGPALLVVNLSRRRWRAPVSMVVTCVAFASVTLSSLKFHDQLRWPALRPYYAGEDRASPTGPDGIHGISWDGGSGGN